jgi:hypothetical protein
LRREQMLCSHATIIRYQPPTAIRYSPAAERTVTVTRRNNFLGRRR